MKKVLTFCLLVSTVGFGQVVVQLDDMMGILSPVNDHHYSTPGFGGNFNVGRLGGPNIYDFSEVSIPPPEMSHNYDVGSIPLLAQRYQAGAFTFGDSPTTIDKNPVFVVNSGTLYLCGDATTVAPTYKFTHHTPNIMTLSFPTVYGSLAQETVDHFDSTFSTSGQLLGATHEVSIERRYIDGYGTLRVMGHEYECIRTRSEHIFGTQYDNKEFMYITRNGLFVIVGGVPLSSPDSGVVSGGFQVMLAASLMSAGVTQAPVSFELAQNFPNPFNPSTTIGFAIPQRSYVKLEVCNLLGQRVATLVDGMREQGTYTAQFNAGSMPSGVYLYRLQAGGTGSVKRMLLVK